MTIKLGPILGLEGNSSYTAIFFSDKDLNPSELRIHLSNESMGYCDSKEQLVNHFFYRFSFDIGLKNERQMIEYSILERKEKLSNIHQENEWKFHVPGIDSIPKIGFASCNGHHDIIPMNMTDDDFEMWDKLNSEHNGGDPFECLILGGDQIYADPIWQEIPYFSKKNLIGHSNTTRRVEDHILNDDDRTLLRLDLENFYEKTYFDLWGNIAISKALSSIPSLMMWDDHDIIDGWGSHPSGLQKSDIFKLIYSVASRYFELFQVRGKGSQSLISNQHFSKHVSFRNYEIIALDNRSKRHPNRIMSDTQFNDLSKLNNNNLFDECRSEVLQEQKTILFVIPVPVAHLNYKQNTEKWLGKLERFKGNFLSSYNDDGIDHWDHHNHITQQSRLIELMVSFGETHSPKYVNILSGDVHSAGAGRIEKKSEGFDYTVNQLISSPIIFKPIGFLPQLLLKLVSNNESKLDDFIVRVQKFGYRGIKSKSIYKKNFGYLTKIPNSGIQFILVTDGKLKERYEHQPKSFKKRSKN